MFAELLDLSPDRRARRLAEICAEDASTGDELRSLLGAHGEAGQFLEPGRDASVDPFIGQQIDRYRVVRLLGKGGMAEVYLAERADATFDKQVALKRIQPGLNNASVVSRFHAERQALANLEHPNIARLIDGGSAEDGRPFLVMEYVDGSRLDEHCDDKQASIEDRLRLFLDVCGAVHFAHQNLIVHRDLKPANVFVNDQGVVKLLDFGIAKFLDADSAGAAIDATATQHRVYTPAYASPEQVRGQPISTATDVYALGVILFELLTGHRPYRISPTATFAEISQAICDQPPEHPSQVLTTGESGADTADRIAKLRSVSAAQLRRNLSGDLAIIVLKALRKEKERRYDSVEAMAEDIRRFLSGHPVLARPDSARYRVGKFVRRNKALVAMASVAAVVLIASSIVSSGLFVRAERARAAEQEQRQQAELSSDFLESLLGNINPDVALGRDTELLGEILKDASARIDDELESSPLIAARMHVVIGSAYNSIGEYERAETHLNQVAAMHASQGDAPPLDVAERLAAQANLASNVGKNDECLEFASQAIEHYEQEGQGRSPSAASVLLLVARAQANLGNYDEAIATLEGMLPWLEASPDLQSQLGECLSRLGRTYAIEMRSAESINTLERAIAQARSVHGDEHRLVGTAYLNLGWAQYRSGQPEAAEANFRESLRICRKVLPADHPDIATSINQLAGALEEQGKHEETEAHFLDAIDRFKASYGDKHPDVGTAYNNLGALYVKMKRYDEASANLQRAADTYGAVLGEDHVYVGIVLQNLVGVYDDQDRLSEARDSIELSRRILSESFGEDDIRTQYMHAAHAMITASEGKFEEAEPVLLAAEKALAEAKNRRLGRSRRFLARFYDMWGRSQEAKQWRDRIDE